MRNLRTDPYETSLDSSLYARFFADQLWLFVPTQQEVGKWLMTFREFPPRAGDGKLYYRSHDATDAANAG